MQDAQPIRVLLARDGDQWVAQCLEYDIGTQAPDLDQLRKRLMVALEAERQESVRRHGAPFAGIGPAPAIFHEQWEKHAQRAFPRPEERPFGEGATGSEGAGVARDRGC